MYFDADSQMNTWQCVQVFARLRPSLPAIIDEANVITYGQLEREVASLAATLAGELGSNKVIGIWDEHDAETVISVLAIWASGSSFLSLDPHLDMSRLSFLADRGCVDTVLQRSDGVVPAELNPVSLAVPRRTRELPEVSQTQAAYITFSSGSTAESKAIRMPHRCLTNLSTWQIRVSRLSSSDRTALLTPFSFDMSVHELCPTLASGGSLLTMRRNERQDPVLCARRLTEGKVTRLHLPYIRLLTMAAFTNPADLRGNVLREVACAGEELLVNPDIRQLFSKSLRGTTLYNHYGPAETHLVTSHPLSGDPDNWEDRPPIGKPIDGVSLVLRDGPNLVNYRDPSFRSLQGELLIGGKGLADGYVGDELQTKRKFFEAEGTRVYRSGDLVSVDEAGNLTFEGRVDDEIKVRGVRVSLGGISALAMGTPGVRWASAHIAGETALEREVILFVVADENTTHDPLAALRENFALRLPREVIPRGIIVVDHPPQVPSGKLDRRSLLALAHSPNE